MSMKFDLHCHTKEGSLDAKVDIVSYIQHLREKGFDGMLVTDHNSYNGYRKWKESAQGAENLKSFVVLKGIEYDTYDGGHMIAILPDHVHCKLLEIRGMTVAKLEKVVHELGGILGPAHPYGIGFFALMNNKWVKRNLEIIHKFDFIETFNSCTNPISNKMAEKLAKKYKKFCFAGSDAHKKHVIGSACTKFDHIIQSNNDLIQAVKEHVHVIAGETKDKIIPKHYNLIQKWLGIIGYWLYNKSGAAMYYFARRKEWRRFFLQTDEK